MAFFSQPAAFFSSIFLVALPESAAPVDFAQQPCGLEVVRLDLQRLFEVFHLIRE